jgi:hypothetical protein
LEVSKRGAEGHGVMVARDFCCFVVSRRAAARQKDDVFYQKAYESTRVTYEPAAVGTGGSRLPPSLLSIEARGHGHPIVLAVVTVLGIFFQEREVLHCVVE